MKKTKKQDDSGFQIVVDSRLMFVGLSIYHFDLFLSMPHGSDIVIVYQFMLKTSQIQKTNKIWCTNTFIKKGTKMGVDRIHRARKNLEKLGLIISDQQNKKDGKFGKTYVQLKYVETKELRENIRKHFLNKIREDLVKPSKIGEIKKDKNTVPGKPSTGSKHGPAILPVPAKQGANALRNTKVLNKNALRKINFKSISHTHGINSTGLFDYTNRFYFNEFGIQRNKKIKYYLSDPDNPDNKFFIYIAKLLKKIISQEYPKMQFPGFEKWFDDIRLLVQRDMKIKPGKVPKEIKQRLVAVLKYYEETIGEEFSFVIQCGKSFRKKFFKIESAIDKLNNGKKSSQGIKSRQGVMTNDFNIIYEEEE